VIEKALALGPLEADLVFLGSGEQGAGPSGAAEGTAPRSPLPLFGTAPRSLLPEQAGRVAGEAVQEAVRLALAGDVDAIVTGPVHKHALHLAGFRYPGLTELLSHLAGDVDVAMMLAAGGLRVILVTTHIALKDVPAQVTVDRVVRCGRIAERDRESGTATRNGRRRTWCAAASRDGA